MALLEKNRLQVFRAITDFFGEELRPESYAAGGL
jgi:hypothetical protein